MLHSCFQTRNGIIQLLEEFCYGVYNQDETFIYLDLMDKNKEIHIER
jgi:hypothetical protein